MMAYIQQLKKTSSGIAAVLLIIAVTAGCGEKPVAEKEVVRPVKIVKAKAGTSS